MATCERWQDAVSARMDGEDPGVSPAALDAHLTGCAQCRSFAARAGALDLMADRPPRATSDRSTDILAAVRADRMAQRTRGTPASPVPRVALALVGVAQLVTSAPHLWSQAGAHTTRDLAAFQLALGIGFVAAAARPATAAGLLPTAATLVVVLAVVVAGDIRAGRVTPVAESLHATEVAGVALLWLLAPRRSTTRRARPA